jgi:3',5'-cyclic AMP phosphodiesterase CpdA
VFCITLLISDYARMAVGDRYRIAHISDPHLTTLRGVGARELCNKRILGYLSWLLRRRREHRREVLAALVQDVHSRGPDHVVITGDLTHIGTPRECAEAATWLQEVSALHPLTLIPGNHDRYIAAPWEKTLGLWGDFMAGDERGTPELARGLFPALRRRGPLAIIGLSSAVPSPPFFASGTLGTAQLHELERLLGQAGRDGLFRLVLVHHPPVAALLDRRRRLTDASGLQQVLKRAGAELILHGHSHCWMQTSVSGPRTEIPALGIPSASARVTRPGRRAGYSILDITTTGSGWDLQVTQFEHAADAGGFRQRDSTHWARARN